MKLKKIVTLWLSLVLFTANITPQYKAFADNEVGNEVKNETAKEAKQKSKENELDLVMAGMYFYTHGLLTGRRMEREAMISIQYLS